MAEQMTFRKQYLLTLGWIVILMILALLTPNPANAQRLELGVGSTRYGTTDGIWYQSTYPHSNDLTGSSQFIGWSAPFAERWQALPPTRFGWRAAAVHLGSFSNSAYWEPDEAFFHPGTFPRCDVVRLSDCWNGDGSGDVWGVSLGLTIERDFGGLTLGAEGGSFLYYGKWTQTWRAPNNASSGVLQMTETHLTPYVGVNARYGYAFVMLRGYKGVHAGLADRVLRQVVVGVSIPFGGDK